MKALIRCGAFASAALLCTSIASAQTVTHAGINIGGQGSLSSEHFDNPGLLADGLTPASANYTLTLSVPDLPATGGTLQLRVENTSPVFVGAPNPKLNEIYLNAPRAVTGMSLTTQVGSAPGVVPSFAFNFDSDPGDSGIDITNQADGFGRFSMALILPSHEGAIANPDADTVTGGDAASTFDVLFSFSLTGDLSGISAEAFVTLLSSAPPPGDRRSYAVGHFMSGGLNGEFSAFISDDHDELLIDLLWFRGSVQQDSVLLGWQTASELNNVGFNVYYQDWSPVAPESMSSSAVRVNALMVPAQGDAFQGASYLLEVRPPAGRSFFWLEDIDDHGILTQHGPFLVR